MVFPAVADGRVESLPVVFVGVLEEVTEIYEFCVFLEKNFDVIVTDGEKNKIRVF